MRDEAIERFGRDQRHVGRQDEDRPIAALGFRLKDGVPGAEAFSLLDHADIRRQRFAQRRRLRWRYDDEPIGERVGGTERIRDEGTAAERMEDFRLAGPHPLAFARSEDHDGQAVHDTAHSSIQSGKQRATPAIFQCDGLWCACRHIAVAWRVAEITQQVLDARRHRSGEVLHLLSTRVHERERGGVEREALEEEWRARSASIDAITDHRMAERRQVNADLMRSTGLEAHVEVRELREAFHHPPARDRALPLPHGKDRHALAVTGIATDRRVHDARRRAHASVYDRDVTALHRAGHELSRQRVIRAWRLRDDEETRRVLVESRHDAGPACATDGCDRRRVREGCCRERGVRVARAGMYDHTRRLVDDEHVVVLVDDRQRERLGAELVGGARRDLDLDTLAALQPMSPLAYDAIDPDVPLLDELLQTGARDIGDARGEPTIEPLARRTGVDGQREERQLFSGTATAGRSSRRNARSATPTVIEESATLNAGQ